MKMYLEIFIFFLLFLLFALVIVLRTGEPGNLFFVWNAFLAFLPLLFAQSLNRYLGRGGKKTGVVALLFILWLLFYPNAPYMITDLIYFGDTSYFVNGGYTTNVLAWVKLIYIAFGVLFGVLMGLRSLYEMHRLILRYKGRKTALAAILVSSLLSGFAIYIGRILRFNSWDVLRPVYLLARIRDELSSFSIIFSLLFALFILGSYTLFYTLVSSMSTGAGEADRGDMTNISQ